MPKEHIIIYFEALTLPVSMDFKIYSEMSGAVANDIHHICTRENRIENLMALTRREHQKFGEVKKYMYDLLLLHRTWLDKHEIEYSKMWFDEKMQRYKPEKDFD